MNEYCKSLVGVTRDLHLDNRFSILRCRDGRIACLIFVSRWEGLRTQGIDRSITSRTDGIWKMGVSTQPFPSLPGCLLNWVITSFSHILNLLLNIFSFAFSVAFPASGFGTKQI
ncbi:Uncharacterized protein APZ42_030141 [Daphnia magna]|uniref:Uncharacterized protein n=1 Tax=Daphnia magna TaxID=35525 RepID=A0A0P4Z6T3_9CRUS|nr:Uncharacterized protein APZ42_030141 [Daphnia magna]